MHPGVDDNDDASVHRTGRASRGSAGRASRGSAGRASRGSAGRASRGSAGGSAGACNSTGAGSAAGARDSRASGHTTRAGCSGGTRGAARRTSRPTAALTGASRLASGPDAASSACAGGRARSAAAYQQRNQRKGQPSTLQGPPAFDTNKRHRPEASHGYKIIPGVRIFAQSSRWSPRRSRRLLGQFPASAAAIPAAIGLAPYAPSNGSGRWGPRPKRRAHCGAFNHE